jgi:hypothetical protein
MYFACMADRPSALHVTSFQFLLNQYIYIFVSEMAMATPPVPLPIDPQVVCHTLSSLQFLNFLSLVLWYDFFFSKKKFVDCTCICGPVLPHPPPISRSSVPVLPGDKHTEPSRCQWHDDLCHNLTGSYFNHCASRYGSVPLFLVPDPYLTFLFDSNNTLLLFLYVSLCCCTPLYYLVVNFVIFYLFSGPYVASYRHVCT